VLVLQIAGHGRVGRDLARVGVLCVCAAVLVCEDHPLMPFRACTATFRDHDGVLQTAKVDAETSFEAAALALKFWSTRQFVKGPGKRAVLEVEVDRPVRGVN
jgi:hypothetical protein